VLPYLRLTEHPQLLVLLSFTGSDNDGSLFFVVDSLIHAPCLHQVRVERTQEVNRGLLWAPRLQPSLPISPCNDERHPVVSRLLRYQLVRLHGRTYIPERATMNPPSRVGGKRRPDGVAPRRSVSRRASSGTISGKSTYPSAECRPESM
jgi:hypothetical protein